MNRLTGSTISQAQPDRDDDLAADDQVVLHEEVVVLADRAVDDVLDGHDAGRCESRGDRIEDRPEGAQRDALDVAERLEHGVLGEGAGLAGICHGSGVGWSHPASLAAVHGRDTPTG